MIETLEHPHLTSPHMLSSSPLTFFFRMALSATSRVPSPGTVWAKGLRVAAQESVVAGAAVSGGGCAALSEGSLFWWFVPCRVLSYAMTIVGVCDV
jgi:hypothetical protein